MLLFWCRFQLVELTLLFCFNVFIHFLCSFHQSSTSSVGGLPSSTSVTPKPEGETLVIKTEAIPTAMPSDTGGGEVVGSTSNSFPAVSSSCNVPQTPVKDSRSSGEGNSSALHWLADLATQKAKDDTKGNYEIPIARCKSRSELRWSHRPLVMPFQSPVHFAPWWIEKVDHRSAWILWVLCRSLLFPVLSSLTACYWAPVWPSLNQRDPAFETCSTLDQANSPKVLERVECHSPLFSHQQVYVLSHLLTCWFTNNNISCVTCFFV